MKYNKGELSKRNQYLYIQKSSFISQRPINTNNSQQFNTSSGLQSHKNLFKHHPNRVSQQKINQSQHNKNAQFLNIFEDQDLSESTTFPKLENCKSSEDLRISFKNKQWVQPAQKTAQPKQSMQSTDSLKFPLKSVSQRNLHSSDNGGSGQILVIKSKNSIKQSKQQDNKVIRQLRNQIKKYEQSNKKIKDQNLQLRLNKMKLSSNSDIMTMIGLKTQLRILTKKFKQLQGIKEDSEYDHSSLGQVYKNPRSISKLQSQSSIFQVSSGNSLKPSTTQIDLIKKTNTPKLAKVTEPINRFTPGPNMVKVQSSSILAHKY